MPMNFSLFKNASKLLLITQLVSIISFAVLYSTLVLFMTQGLGFTVTKASAIMGVFLHLTLGFISWVVMLVVA